MNENPTQTLASEATKRDWHDTLTIRQVVEEYGIPENTLRWWRKNGGGPDEFPTGFTVGRSVRYRRDDIDNWFQTQYERAASNVS